MKWKSEKINLTCPPLPWGQGNGPVVAVGCDALGWWVDEQVFFTLS